MTLPLTVATSRSPVQKSFQFTAWLLHDLGEVDHLRDLRDVRRPGAVHVGDVRLAAALDRGQQLGQREVVVDEAARDLLVRVLGVPLGEQRSAPPSPRPACSRLQIWMSPLLADPPLPEPQAARPNASSADAVMMRSTCFPMADLFGGSKDDELCADPAHFRHHSASIPGAVNP